MAVTKEWRCLAHGPFDSATGVCPSGCSTVVREFRTAPGTRSEKTKTSDRALARLAERYNFTDLSNKRGSVGATRAADGMQAKWLDMPKGNKYEVGKGEVPVDGSVGGASAALSGVGMTGSVAAKMAEKYGKPFDAEPNIMDVTKALPKMRPHVVADWGKGAELKEAIDHADTPPGS
jgi:hypothetical protein